MARQTRYVVRFTGSGGIYREGDEVGLDAEQYARELRRKPAIVVELLHELREELDGNGTVITSEVVAAPPKALNLADKASEAVLAQARVAELEQQLADLRERIVLGTDPERERLVEEHQGLKKRVGELEGQIAGGADTVLNLQGQLTAAQARIAELEDAAKPKKPAKG